MSEFDLVVIGAGPGGYVAAIKAAQLGLKTACVDRRESLGGTCLNVGCIPSKALLHSSEKFSEARGHLAAHGVVVGDIRLDLAAMQARKTRVVADLTKGIDFLFKKNGVEKITGSASLRDAHTVQVGERTLRTKAILIATGSEVASLPGVTIDEDMVVSSTGALAFDAVPKHLVVIGGGVIGLELGSVWQRLGGKVTVVEYLDRILPGMDADVSKEMLKILQKQGMTFRLQTKVISVSPQGQVTVAPAAGGAEETLDADKVLVAVGRKPFTDGLGLDAVGITLDDRGRIPVDGHYQTAVAGIYAIGDVIAGPMLAHKAEEEGVAVAERLAGQKPHINYDAIPSVVYTAPEAASVGLTEQQAQDKGIKVAVCKFPFMANSRARAVDETDGFVKLIANADNDEIVGAHIVGAQAGTLIAELALALEYRATAEDIARTCHAHPTLNEAVKEAALGVWEKPIHI